METLIEFGVFAGKVVLIVLGILIVFGFIFSIAAKNKSAQDDHLKVTHLGRKFKELTQALKEELLDKKQLKKEKKEEEKCEKEKLDIPQKNVFVLDFEGDIKASGVDKLRDEISTLLSLAKDGDEVVVCVNSPGGMVHTYGLAAAQLLRIKKKGLPLTICVDKVAASGGYMMACTGNKIIAAPFAILGSIGVLAQVPNIHRLLKKHDVDYEEITAGEFKRTLTLMGEITEKGREKFTEQIIDTHTLFKNFVEQNRPQINIASVATGEYWFGTKALELGLIDEVMTSDEYLLEKTKDYRVLKIELTKKKKFAEKIAEAMSGSIQTQVDKATQLFFGHWLR